jgi:hypothetical protein
MPTMLLSFSRRSLMTQRYRTPYASSRRPLGRDSTRTNPGPSPLEGGRSLVTPWELPTTPPHDILGFQFWSTVRQPVNATWSYLTWQVQSHAKDSYPRDLCLAHRITYVHVYLLARICVRCAGPSGTSTCIQQITSTMKFFIWKGATFRVPISTLQSYKAGGGWRLMDIHAKCRALLLSRMHSHGARA